MLPIEQLVDRLPDLLVHTTPFVGRLVRAFHPRFWEDPLGLGRAEVPPGRFNDAGGPPVLYLGDDFYTCAGESEILSTPREPIAFAAVDCRLARTLDLRAAEVQRILETNEIELAAPIDHSVPGPTTLQRLGAFLAGTRELDAVFNASARRPGHHCVAVFMDSLAPPSELRLVDPRRG